MPVAVLKSMSDVVTRGLICEADPWETESERMSESQIEGRGETKAYRAKSV